MTTPKYPTEIEPWIWLQEGEQEGYAHCGCHLAMDNGAKLNFCTVHAAAEELLETLTLIICQERPEGLRERCQALIRKAKGGKP